MADDQVEPRAGELTTTNYGWTKPTTGGSTDAWGGYINADLDGIDSVVHGIDTRVIPGPSLGVPLMDGTAVVGTGTTYARADHVHPTDTSRYAASNPAGYQTAAQVTAVVPIASSTTPVMDGAAAVGAGTTWARADHVHPTDTSRASVAAVAALPAAMNDNRIINGDMRIDQRGVASGAGGTAINTYTIDRWYYQGTQAAKGTWFRGTTSLAGFPYALLFTSSSAYAVAVGDSFNFQHRIEADLVSDFAWGTPQAQPVTLSFWTYSSLGGTFSGSLANPGGTRSYPFSYTISASAWTKIVVTIPGDMSGSWTLSGSAETVRLYFDLGTGSTFRGPANAWASANYIGATGSVNVVGTNAATFYLTGVKLEIGSVATPYNRQSLAKSVDDCQRYYEKSYDLGSVPGATGTGSFDRFTSTGHASATNFASITSRFHTAKRTAPAIVLYSPQTGAVGMAYDRQNLMDVTGTVASIGQHVFTMTATMGVATTQINFGWHWTADAEL